MSLSPLQVSAIVGGAMLACTIQAVVMLVPAPGAPGASTDVDLPARYAASQGKAEPAKRAQLLPFCADVEPPRGSARIPGCSMRMDRFAVKRPH